MDMHSLNLFGLPLEEKDSQGHNEISSNQET